MSPVLLNPSRFASGGGGGGGYAAEVLTDTPLFYWRLGEASGTTAADASGNSRAGTYTNSPTLGTAGLVTADSDTAITLAVDSGQCCAIASASWMDGLTALSVEAIVKFSSSTDTTNGDAIVSRYNSGGYQWLLWRTTSGKFGFQIQVGGSFINATGTTSVALSTKYHVVGTWDGSNARIYVNGTLEATTATSGSIATSTAALEVGRYSGANATTPGVIVDEAAMFGAALSGTRVSAHAAAA